jgi:hypothetical protein
MVFKSHNPTRVYEPIAACLNFMRDVVLQFGQKTDVQFRTLWIQWEMMAATLQFVNMH